MKINNRVRIIAISGDGSAAGKTFAASVFAQATFSIASGIRCELQRLYPGYQWSNREQSYKNTTLVKEYGGGRHTVRGVLLEYGQSKCRTDPCHWVSLLGDQIAHSLQIASGIRTLAIDDIRKTCELDHLRQRFPDLLVHLHVASPTAVHEPEFDAETLKAKADYVVAWHKD